MDPSLSFFESDILLNSLSDESSSYLTSSPDTHSDDQIFLQDPSPLTSPVSDDIFNLLCKDPYDFIDTL